MRKAHLALFLVVFVDLLGLGILAPLIPFYVERLGVTPEIITLVIAVYALCQFLGTPFWGGVSDRIGRKPVLLMSMAGHAASYLILAYADSLLLLIASRALGGFTSANLATAYAYVADTTTEDERAKGLGRISAAFGLGFIFGPLIGGVLATVGSDGATNFFLPAITAMGLSLLSCLGIWLFIPETAKPQTHDVSTRRAPANLFKSLAEISRRPIIFKAILLCFITVLFMAGRETILPLWADNKHAMSVREVGFIISIAGLTLTSVQLTLIGPLTRKFGESNLLKASLLLFAAGWLSIALATTFLQIIGASILSGIATAFFQTSLQSLLSKRAGASERGSVMGVYQATSSLGRFTGQAGSGTIYAQIGVDAVFLLGAVAMAPALILAVLIAKGLTQKPRLKSSDKSDSEPQSSAEPPIDKEIVA